MKLDGILEYEPAKLEELVPEQFREGMRRYIEKGIKTGSALWAIICNMPICEAVRLDDSALPDLPQMIRFLHNYAPAVCHGSEQKARLWIEFGGLEGYVKLKGLNHDG